MSPASPIPRGALLEARRVLKWVGERLVAPERHHVRVERRVAVGRVGAAHDEAVERAVRLDARGTLSHEAEKRHAGLLRRRASASSRRIDEGLALLRPQVDPVALNLRVTTQNAHEQAVKHDNRVKALGNARKNSSSIEEESLNRSQKQRSLRAIGDSRQKS